MTTFPSSLLPAVSRLLVPAGVVALAGLGYWLHHETSESADLGRLQAIPLEQRRAYWETLQEFDRLPADRRRAIEDLDRRLQDMPPEERDRYLATLHRYAVWHRAQPPSRQAELAELDIDDRVARFRLYWADGRTGREPAPIALFLQSPVLTPLGLIDSAYLLRVWFAVTPEQRREIQAIKPFDAKVQQLTARAAELQMDRDFSPVRDQLETLRSQARPKAEAGDGEQALLRRAEAGYFLQHEPRTLPTAERLRFDAVLPDWFQDTTVLLPADVARRRLDLLYELVFGADGMPANLKPDPRTRPAASPASRPAGRPSAPIVPL